MASSEKQPVIGGIPWIFGEPFMARVDEIVKRAWKHDLLERGGGNNPIRNALRGLCAALRRSSAPEFDHPYIFGEPFSQRQDDIIRGLFDKGLFKPNRRERLRIWAVRFNTPAMPDRFMTTAPTTLREAYRVRDHWKAEGSPEAFIVDSTSPNQFRACAHP